MCVWQRTFFEDGVCFSNDSTPMSYTRRRLLAKMWGGFWAKLPISCMHDTVHLDGESVGEQHMNWMSGRWTWMYGII